MVAIGCVIVVVDKMRFVNLYLGCPRIRGGWKCGLLVSYDLESLKFPQFQADLARAVGEICVSAEGTVYLCLLDRLLAGDLNVCVGVGALQASLTLSSLFLSFSAYLSCS